MTKIPQTLKDRLSEGQVVPVICAGVSMSINNTEGEPVFPSWPNLLLNAAEQAETENESKKANAIRSLVDIDALQQAANIAKETLIGSTWSSFLTKQFDVNLEQLDKESASLQKAIWKLSKRLITLNYDHCLEWAHENPANISSFDNSNTTQLSNFKNNKLSKDMVWHLHGTIKNPDHLVLTPTSYDLLYNKGGKEEYLAALATLKEVMSSKSLLFIGSSMSDIELLTELHNQNKLFSGNTGPHYALVKEGNKEEVRAKLGDLNSIVSIITFPEFGEPLVSLVECLSHHNKDGEINSVSTKKKINTESKKTISIHIADPLDKPREYDYLKKFIRSFKKDVDKYYLSADSIWIDSDYTFIFSNLTKNGLLIEDDSCCSEYLPLESVLEELPINTKGSFIFVDKISKEITEEQLRTVTSLPVAIYEIDKECKSSKRKIDSINHQLFRKNNINIFDKGIILNKDKFDLDFDLKNLSINDSSRNTKLINIEKSSVSNFIGRSSDLATISRELTRIEDKTLALVLKGSGGIGKTTISKKLAIEYSKRGKFEHGITLIDCEPIDSYSQFYKKISASFELTSIENLVEHLQENNFDNNRLLILDNFESILNLNECKSVKCFLDLVGSISEFCSIILTTRQNTQEPWEQELVLRSLDSDEALELFNIHTGNSYSSKKQQKFIKEELIEKQLDKNPLAIKLIASNIPPGKDINEISEDISIELSSIDSSNYFNSSEDLNISRQQSLIGSVAYSYKTLNEREKRAIELISLFPDGISLKNLRMVFESEKSKEKSKFIISDREIKSLSNKSMLDNNGKNIKLHSIVSRFIISIAKENKDNHPYWQKVAKYNFMVCRAFTDIFLTNEWLAVEIFLSNYNNLLLTMEMLDNLDFDIVEPDELFNYIYHTSRFCQNISSTSSIKSYISRFLEIVKSRKEQFSSKYPLMLELILLNFEYHEVDCISSSKNLKEIYPIEEMNYSPANETDIIETRNRDLAIFLYADIGFTKELYKFMLLTNTYGHYYPLSFVLTGFFSPDILNNCDKNYNYFEIKRAFNILDPNEIQDYLNNLHPQEHYSRCMISYLMNKEEPLEFKEINKLVTTDDCTKSVKNAIKAQYYERKISSDLDGDVSAVVDHYELAIDNLNQNIYIKISILFDYCSFLIKNSMTERFNYFYNQAMSLSTNYEYPYWINELKRLVDPSITPFSSENVENPYDMDPSNYIKEFIEDHKRVKKKYRNYNS